MGQQQTDDTLRLYIGAGGGHNVTGPSQVDTLTLLENWVEKGQAPPDMVAAFEVDPVTLNRARSMPACRYPAYARYSGTGDPKQAESFTCTNRPDPLAFQPTP
jgi:feruloyl esterase